MSRAENSNLTGSPAHQSVWHVPKLRLSLSGFETKEVILVMTTSDRIDNEKDKEVEGNVEDTLDGGFEDDEHGILQEAMTQILTRIHGRFFHFRC